MKIHSVKIDKNFHLCVTVDHYLNKIKSILPEDDSIVSDLIAFFTGEGSSLTLFCCCAVNDTLKICLPLESTLANHYSCLVFSHLKIALASARSVAPVLNKIRMHDLGATVPYL